jgi:hypothetical protein
MEAKNPEAESETIWNLYIVHEPARFGGPFGVFVDVGEEALFDRIANPVTTLMEIPGKGLLAVKFEKAMKDYAIKRAAGWYDIPIEELLSSLGEVLSDNFDRDKCAHYAGMMDIE